MDGSENNTLFPTGEPTKPPKHTVRLAFDTGADTEFDYAVPDNLWPIHPGQRVHAPLGRSNHTKTAFVVQTNPSDSYSAKARLKSITTVLDDSPLLDPAALDLARWISQYYVCPLGQVLAAMVPAAVKKNTGLKKIKFAHLNSAPPTDSSPKGPKQSAILQYLIAHKATSPQTALPLSDITQHCQCTPAPLKSLANRSLVKFTTKPILKSLPVIPEQFAAPADPVTLNPDQQAALDHITARLDSNQFSVSLLHGVTDSGKTEVYIRAAEHCLKLGKSAIILLPEIALTAQTVQRFSTRFTNLAVMHSHLTAAQRNHQWQNIKSGAANVVIGARSAIFAPLTNLGLIVVDEEHEPSYKQDTAPRYHARDVAIKRAQQTNSHVILGSATPSLESLHNCKTKPHFHLLKLPNRVNNLPLPEMRLIDLTAQSAHPKFRPDKHLLSPPLAAHLRRTLEKKEQAILLLNRRGYSHFIFCPSCHHSLHCRNCDVTLTFHRRKLATPNRPPTITGSHLHSGYAVCHHCLSKTLVPESCPLCGKRMTMIGLGSQKLEEQLRTQFPTARIARVDTDSMQSSDYYSILKDFSQGKIDILAGTQMLAKGLHFPNVTLVGIISADTALYLPDFRTNERTFQLIHQVAGRTGRSEKKGTVYIQTFFPDQPAIKYAVNNDFEGFIAEESKHRRACDLPPYWRMAAVTLRDQSWEKLEAAAADTKNKLTDQIQRHNLPIRLRGPLPPVITRLHRQHRLQIILQAPNPTDFVKLFTQYRTSPPPKPTVHIAIDPDPINLL